MPYENTIFMVSSECSINIPKPAEDSSCCTTNSSSSNLLQEPSTMGYCRWRWNWVFNALVLFSLIGLIVVFEIDVIPFQQVGFQCGDPKLSHKFTGDSISFSMLLGTTFFAPLVVTVLVETLVAWPSVRYQTSEKKQSLGGVKRGWYWYCQYLLGLLLVIFIIEAAKSIVAEPRPHFLDTCRPDKAVNCTTGYVSSFKCTNNIKRTLLRDSTKSFPSGHAALGIYMAIFMIWYFQKRIPETSYLVVPWLQCVFAFWALLCALTRLTDHRHHWWDVLAGAICGFGLAVYTVNVQCKGFLLSQPKTAKSEKPVNEVTSNGRYPSSRRLLSSTSSYTPPDDRELKEVQMT